MRPIDRYADALRHTLRASLAMGHQLTEADWKRPTECPLWTVGDVYAHLAGGEQWMADGSPPVPPPPGEFQAWVDAGVLSRRGRSPATVLAELTSLYDRRDGQLILIGEPDAPAHYPWGTPTTVEGLLATRVFDCWVHEQDIRRATGRPGNLGSPGARVSRDVLVESLPRIVARGAGAPPGSAVRLTVTGEVGLDVAVAVDTNGRGRLVPPEEADLPAVHITLGWEAYARLSCGRGERSAHQIWLTGDLDLGERILARLAITP